MLRLQIWLSIVLFVALIPSFVLAMPFSETGELLQGARLMYSQTPSEQNYQLVLGSIKKVNNRWRTENDKRIEGLVTRKTFELRPGLSFTEARSDLLASIRQRPNVRWLFRCAGLDCGSSNGWANEYLKIKQLYGLDNYQYYAVLESDSGDAGHEYWVVYLVQRGNQRIYLQVDSIVSQQRDPGLAVDAKTLVEVLREIGYFSLPGDWSIKPEQEDLMNWVESIRQALSLAPNLKLFVVGHAYSGETLQEARAQSRQYAGLLRDALVQAGVSKDRLEVFGIGNLAPAGGPGRDRVELVAQGHF